VPWKGLAVNHTAIYRYDPDDRVWLVSLADEPRCHSYGRTLTQANRNIRDAANLWFETEVDVTDVVQPPAGTEEVVGRYRKAREAQRLADAEAATAAVDAVETLARVGMSQREAAAVLTVSFQRVHQLLTGAKVSNRAAAKIGSRKGTRLKVAMPKGAAVKAAATKAAAPVKASKRQGS
jgi:predicted RNase H-like HicB family nuclease